MTNFESILHEGEPNSSWSGLEHGKAYIRSIYEVTKEGCIKMENVDLSNETNIKMALRDHNIFLFILVTEFKSPYVKGIQEYVKPLWVDDQLNMISRIAFEDYSIDYFGDLIDRNGHTVSKDRYHGWDQPFKYNLRVDKEGISCPSERQYLEHYNYLARRLGEFVDKR